MIRIEGAGGRPYIPDQYSNYMIGQNKLVLIPCGSRPRRAHVIINEIFARDQGGFASCDHNRSSDPTYHGARFRLF